VARAVVEVAGRAWDIYVDAGRGPVSSETDVFFPPALAVAMASGLPLHVDQPVSPRLLEGARKVQVVLSSWFPRSFRRVPVEAEARRGPFPAPSPRAATMFSGGADSFYTALHNPDVEALVFVHGFDFRLDEPRLPVLAGQIRETARELDKELVELKTNLRYVSDAFVPRRLAFGFHHACMAYLLAHRFGKVYVAGTPDYTAPWPDGSHPLLDPFWSGESTEVVYDGYDQSRWDKLLYLASNPVARRRLRVCTSNDPQVLTNCGRCEKCLRTMTILEVEGLLDRFPAFPSPLRLQDLDRITVRGEPFPSLGTWNALQEILEDGGDPRLREAVHGLVRRTRRYHGLPRRLWGKARQVNRAIFRPVLRRRSARRRARAEGVPVAAEREGNG
jgi:hypothetical protein